MKPLLVLLSVFIIGFLLKTLAKNQQICLRFVGKLAMSSMLIFTGIAHFAFAEGMAEMLPAGTPYKLAMIYATGIIEVLGAVGLLINQISRTTGILLILFLIAILPANIYAAIHHIDPTTGLLNGHGPMYLLFRVPLQLFYIAWIYGFSVVKKNKLSIFTLN